MAETTHSRTCFNCGRSDQEIPIINWQYREQPLWVCSECMPMLIHKWAQVKARLDQSS
ncbi:MAG: hypothetical protein KC425_02445 [Anaerolineales bacterium]|nr:hypothetical protein [Anaerolineales bacterium]